MLVFFVELLAIECGNCALATLPEGGIYIVGNVISRIRDWILNDPAKTFEVNIPLEIFLLQRSY